MLALLAVGCHSGKASSGASEGPGDRLEQAALARGLVSDPVHVEVAGLYARDGDRVCVTPFGNAFRVGAVVRFDDGPACEAAGTAQRTATTLAVHVDEGCRFNATIEGDRIIFPVDLPAACDKLCTGRASFAGLVADHLSTAVAEAEALRDAHGRALCNG